MSEVAAYDLSESLLRIVDVDAHRARLALAASGGICVVEEFINRNHTPTSAHPNPAGGVLKLPPDPGSTAIPAGHVRLWHYSNIDREKGDERPWGEVIQSRVKSLRERGILMDAAKTQTYGEPRQIWAAAGKTVSGNFLDNKIMVEFHADPKTLDIGRDMTPEHLEGNQSHVTIFHDIPPSDIIAIHEPWHERARYFRDNPTTMADAQAGKHDSLMESDPLDYGPAIRWAKQQPKVPQSVLDAKEAEYQVRKAAYEAKKAKEKAATASAYIEEFYNKHHRGGGPGGGQFDTASGSGVAGTTAVGKSTDPKGVGGSKTTKAQSVAAPKLKRAKTEAVPTTPIDPNRVGQRLLSKKAGGPGKTTLHLDEISKEGIDGMIHRLHEVGAVPKHLKTVEQVVDFIAKNVTSVYDKVSPADRAAWKKWYEGANKLGSDMSGHAGQMSKTDLGLSHQGANAAIAVLSPSTQWNINVAQSRAAVRILREDKPLTAAQAKTANGLAVATFGRQHEAWGRKTEKARVALIELHSLREKTTDAAKLKKIDEAIAKKYAVSRTAEPTTDKLPVFKEGQKPSEMSDYATGYAFRAVDPHPVLRDVKIKADGTYDDSEPMMTATGKVQSSAWTQSYTNFAKLTSVYRDSSIENISKQLGDAHKVRSFFNNINDPNNKAGDVTIDTHAYGIGLGKPLSTSHPWIDTKAGSKNITARPDSLADGTKGVYAIVQAGFTRAAEQAGIQPREMQSITWEAWRRMHTVSERAANVRRIGKEGKKAVM